jgi:hypothetical protein
VAPAPSEFERDLQQLAVDLRRLEGEYNMFFAGRKARPPHETRSRVEGLLKRLERAPLESVAQRFRLQTLQARYATFAELWERNMRGREEGRASATPQRSRERVAPDSSAGTTTLVHEVRVTDPAREMDRIEALYESLMDARRAAGDRVVPFHRFARFVQEQMAELRRAGTSEVTFRVAVQEGKVRLLASGTRDAGE